MQISHKVRACGGWAAFNRPELSVERFSYPVITPSAARGILDAIMYHPGMRWKIKRIYVEKPIVYTNIRRNEVSDKALASDVLSAMNGSGKAIYIDRRDRISQRAATVLSDVSYVIEAYFELVPSKMSPSDSEEKFYNMFLRRARSGKCFSQPYLGCREFPASFELLEGDEKPNPIHESQDFGLMLYDMDYSDQSNITPIFFHAEMIDGVVEVEGKELYR